MSVNTQLLRYVTRLRWTLGYLKTCSSLVILINEAQLSMWINENARIRFVKCPPSANRDCTERVQRKFIVGNRERMVSPRHLCIKLITTRQISRHVGVVKTYNSHNKVFRCRWLTFIACTTLLSKSPHYWLSDNSLNSYVHRQLWRSMDARWLRGARK